MVDSSYDRVWSELLGIMRRLRSPGGCPWDIEQTHSSIKSNLLEEAYEVIDAINRGDSENLCEELGDLLLQVVFHAQIASEAGEFDIGDVLTGLCNKLIVRHPHIFGGIKLASKEDVLLNWDHIKREEKGQSTLSDVLLDIPASFPSLMRAFKLIKRAKKAGLTIPDEIQGTDIGRRLFMLVAEAQDSDIDPELALLEVCDYFISTAEGF